MSLLITKETLSEALLIGGVFNEIRSLMSKHPSGISMIRLLSYLDELGYDERFVRAVLDALIQHRGYYCYDGDDLVPVARFAEEALPQITILHGGEWSGIYVGDNLLQQDHSLDASRVVEGLGYSVSFGDWDQKDLDAQLDTGNPFPKKLSDIPCWLAGEVPGSSDGRY